MIIYAVSDSIGETAEQVAKATASQFDNDVKIKRASYINSKVDAINFINSIENKDKCLILSTIVVEETREFLVKLAIERDIEIINVLGPCINAVSEIINETPIYKPGAVRRLDEDYFRKIEAMEFALSFDDGKSERGLLNADLVIIGVSRTSKTPLSIYIANKGIKVANVPLVPETPVPEALFEINRRKIIGLTIDPRELMAIRHNRITRMGTSLHKIEYANAERILAELEYAEKIMRRIRCKVFDVTRKAIEETASQILEYVGYNEDIKY
ncbi:pyruvate, water dikinase regulatory protein [Clostridium cylindrosporum]|uniref:Putative pyruvate, phosphate dikinase regulatory protein n=1 Tax=Clostridium cylindrosporum DSM 605 TaxID=1121307 RepID=A0A0J8D3X5_CLOCY|nr:pyruvate, water dikinase regulatory protein [Clostridium cylindrosporum]KMT20870.1 putative pyruvate, phosphate dikinase regulatory protein [Clostridium cylindrosporum DSM 605]